MQCLGLDRIYSLNVLPDCEPVRHAQGDLELLSRLLAMGSPMSRATGDRHDELAIQNAYRRGLSDLPA